MNDADYVFVKELCIYVDNELLLEEAIETYLHKSKLSAFVYDKLTLATGSDWHVEHPPMSQFARGIIETFSYVDRLDVDRFDRQRAQVTVKYIPSRGLR